MVSPTPTESRPADNASARHAATATSRRPRNRRRVIWRWIKRGIAALVVLAAIALVVRAAMPKPIAVDIAVVKKGPMRVTVNEDGNARVKDRYIVSAPLSGRLARIELAPGDSVDERKVVARIVPLRAPLLDERSKSTAEARVAVTVAAKRQSRAQLQRAKVALEFANTEAQRLEELVTAGALPRQQLDTARFRSRTAKADLDSVRFGTRVADHELRMARAALGHLSGKSNNVEQLEVPAPVSGRVLKVLHENEGVVQAGTPLLEVGDPGALEIVVDVLTRDAVTIKNGAQATIDRWGGGVLDARVRLVEPSAFTRLSALGVQEQRVNVVIELVSPRDQWLQLGDGYRIEAHITVWQSDEVVQIPASAVFRHEGKWAVFIVEEMVAKLTLVTIGRRNGRDVQIVEGLEPGVRVILHPSNQVRNGVEVVSR